MYNTILLQYSCGYYKPVKVCCMCVMYTKHTRYGNIHVPSYVFIWLLKPQRPEKVHEKYLCASNIITHTYHVPAYIVIEMGACISVITVE